MSPSAKDVPVLVVPVMVTSGAPGDVGKRPVFRITALQGQLEGLVRCHFHRTGRHDGDGKGAMMFAHDKGVGADEFGGIDGFALLEELVVPAILGTVGKRHVPSFLGHGRFVAVGQVVGAHDLDAVDGAHDGLEVLVAIDVHDVGLA